MVLLFVKNYLLLLMHVLAKRAIFRHFRRLEGVEENTTHQMTASQLLAYEDSSLFSDIRTEKVHSLTKSDCIKCQNPKSLLKKRRQRHPSKENTDWIVNLHLVHCRNTEFKEIVKSNCKTMYLFTTKQENGKNNV